MARPRTLNKEIIDKICELVKLGVSFDNAARASGISPATYYRCKHDALAFFENNVEVTQHFTPEYVELLEYFIESSARANAEGEIYYAQVLHDAAKEDWHAALKVLERRFGWINKTEIEHTHRGGQGILANARQQQIDVSKMSIAELQELANSSQLPSGAIEGEFNETP